MILSSLYHPLIGASFTATYQGMWPMPQTGNQRDVLEIAAGSDFFAKLHQISSAVLALEYGARVWKGITGPSDTKGYTNYWLWVEPGVSGNLLVGSTYNFSIVSADVFLCPGGTFSYGVSLKAAVHLV